MKLYQWWSCCCLGWMMWGCASTPEPTEVPPTPVQDTIQEDTLLQDTVPKLVTSPPGTIPEGWERVDLDKGYYIGFPKEPKKYNKKDLNQVTYRYKRTAYLLTLSQTDLSQDSSFQVFRKEREAYYDAIFEDLSNEFATTIDRVETVNSGGYSGKKAIMSDEEGMVITAQCLFVGSTLYALNCIAWKGEDERLLKTKAQFFNSFGKDLYIE